MINPNRIAWSSSLRQDKMTARRWMQEWQVIGNQTVTSTAVTPVAGGLTVNGTTNFAVLPHNTRLICNSDGTSSTIVSGWVTMTDPSPVPGPARLAAPLAFSPYINATELVVEFLQEARRLIPGLTRERFLRLTIADFFAFLIRRAAETDGVRPPEMGAGELPNLLRRPRCGWCGRFLSKRLELARMYHCGVPCLTRALDRDGIVLAR